jgi:hypothetical protein
LERRTGHLVRGLLDVLCIVEPDENQERGAALNRQATHRPPERRSGHSQAPR